MGRSRTQETVLRPEVRLPAAHPATKQLLREARDRDVSLAQHIHDLLIARQAAIEGRDYRQALWTPGEPELQTPATPAQNELDAPQGAASAAAAWKRRRSGG